jgi:hypothetical protein
MHSDQGGSLVFVASFDVAMAPGWGLAPEPFMTLLKSARFSFSVWQYVLKIQNFQYLDYG